MSNQWGNSLNQALGGIGTSSQGLYIPSAVFAPIQAQVQNSFNPQQPPNYASEIQRLTEELDALREELRPTPGRLIVTGNVASDFGNKFVNDCPTDYRELITPGWGNSNSYFAAAVKAFARRHNISPPNITPLHNGNMDVRFASNDHAILFKLAL